MLPFLVFEMFFIMVMTVFVFAGGIVATVSYCCYWELGLKAMIVGSVSVCKYYFKHCVINILFLFINLSDVE